MAGPVKGDVVVVRFPFSDLSNAKKRPALVVCTLTGNDVILFQITSKKIKDKYALGLKNADFDKGSLKQDSNLRPNRLFTADVSLIQYRIGHIKKEKTTEVINKMIEIIKN